MESAGNISGLTLDDSALMSSEDEREARGARASQATTMAPAYCKPGARVSVAARDFNLPEDIKNGSNWAEQTFGPAWQHTRLPGTIITVARH